MQRCVSVNAPGVEKCTSHVTSRSPISPRFAAMIFLKGHSPTMLSLRLTFFRMGATGSPLMVSLFYSSFVLRWMSALRMLLFD